MNETITVAQLIELLQRVPQNLSVKSDGCDCTGDAIGILLVEDDGEYAPAHVLICRDNWRNQAIIRPKATP